MIPIGKQFLLKEKIEAFNFLVDRGQFPPEAKQDMTDKEKIDYINKLVRDYGGVPAEFFIYDPEEAKEMATHKQYKALGFTGKLGSASEPLKKRTTFSEPTLATPDPQLESLWTLSQPESMGRDKELDSLSRSEIEDRARGLDKDDPKNTAMLLRLRDAWERVPFRGPRGPITLEADDPLAGLPDPRIFGDSDLLAVPSRLSPCLRPFRGAKTSRETTERRATDTCG